MEYKIRMVHQKKQAKVRNKIENGFKRLKVRGRKRWVKPAAKSATA